MPRIKQNSKTHKTKNIPNVKKKLSKEYQVPKSKRITNINPDIALVSVSCELNIFKQ